MYASIMPDKVPIRFILPMDHLMAIARLSTRLRSNERFQRVNLCASNDQHQMASRRHSERFLTISCYCKAKQD